MPIKLVTAATSLPLSVEEFKAHLRVDSAAEDVDLASKLQAACATLEGNTNTARAFLTSTWDFYLNHWPCLLCGSCFCGAYWAGGRCGSGGFVSGYRNEKAAQIVLPKGQLQEVTSIIYTAVDGTPTTWPETEYEVDTASDPGRIVLAYGKTWPSVTLKRSNAIVIRLIAGWEDAESVPFPLKAAILLEAAHLYRNREAVTTGRVDVQSRPLAHGVADLIEEFRIRGVITQ